jgi:alpha-N-arabinofuranosidase
MSRSSLALIVCLLSEAAAPSLRAAESGLMKNPGFEATLDSWSVHIYGALPRIEADREVFREGKQSLRVSAAAPSDTALGQEVALRPGACYRFSGWVRTRQLEPHGAPVCGTFQIQLPGGRGVLASGTNHQGDTDWTRVMIVFEAPPDGRARIAVFLVGFGKGTGTAWFDDLKLEEVDLAQSPVRVTRTPLYAAEISPLQYGQFIEYLCDLVPGMWAEKLYDGSFEGLSPYKFFYLKETDFREKPWHPTGATNRATFTRDTADPVSGQFCQKIAVPDGAPCTVGIAQDGLAVESHQPCVFSCYLRQEGLKDPVRVRIHCDSKEYAACEFRPTGAWKKYRARLAFRDAGAFGEPLAPPLWESWVRGATLSITFRGPGTLWLDNASLMPERTVGGWRPDVVEAVRSLKPGVIRFGGSALDDPGLGTFDWRDTVGDPDRRKPFRAWGGLQPTGPGLEEIVQFCRHVGAEPLICVRVTGKTPQDAAEQVQYFNGAPDTPQGKLRAKNGHQAPYGIKYWQVGNERSGADYEARLPAFCRAMKAADPSIQLLSSYPTPGVLRGAGAWLDYVCPHHYGCADLAGMENDLNAIRAMIRRETPGRPIKVAVTEWNTTAGDIGPRRAMLWSLDNALACARYHNLLHRHGDLVVIANRSNLTNSFCSGIIQTDNHRLFVTPTYHAQRLYARLAGSRALKLESPLPVSVAPDLSATLSGDGTVLTLFAVNATLHDVTRPLDLSAFGDGAREAAVWTLTDTRHAGEPDVANSFTGPERVRPVESKFKATSPRFAYRFPALSLTVLRWQLK